MTTKRMALALAISFLLAGSVHPLGAQQLTKVRVRLGDVSLNKLIFTVAEDAGIYKRNGLDVSQYISSGAASRAARAGVNIPDQYIDDDGSDIRIGGGTPTMVSRVTNATTGDRIILASTDHFVRWHIVARDGITTPQQLKGKKIGYSGFGAMTHFEALAFSQQMGWDPNQDLILMSNGLALDTFEDGTVDAFVADELVYTMAVAKGYNAVVDLSQYNVPIAGSGVTASREWVENNRDTVRRFIKSTVEAVALLKQNKQVVRSSMAKWYDITDLELQDILYRDNTKLPRKPYPHVEGIKKTMELYDTLGMRIHEPEDFYDDSFVRELDESGFIDSLYR